MRLPALLLVLLAAGCAQTTATPAPSTPTYGAASHSASPGGADVNTVSLSASGDFAPGTTQAIVYDRKLAPEGARASILVESASGKTRSSLVVEGLLPNRAYGAHLHTKPCGAKPGDSGPHYQHETGKATAKNEVWLDFTTDADGGGRATARNPWLLDRARLPRSLVIHAESTETAPPSPGTAGARVACLTIN